MPFCRHLLIEDYFPQKSKNLLQQKKSHPGIGGENGIAAWRMRGKLFNLNGIKKQDKRN
jgi:hypothetical protein